MPLFPPQQSYDYGQGGYAGARGMPQQPMLPNPNVSPMPPDPTRAANPTGGPAVGMQAPERMGANSQLYKLGQQAPMLPPMPPMPMAPPPPPPPMLAPQAAPLPGPMPAPGQAGGPPHPIDRFPRLNRLMGRPVLPSPDGKR